ncbi:MAG: septal ring lytic transglycosylase RlpA family protein [Bacteroidota bacterium]
MRYSLSLCLFLLATACLSAQSTEYGLASYYGDYLHGRPTASGEKYDFKKFTCAHRSLDFGTMLKVTRTDNNKYVVVRVNDRGPFVKGRIVDLSRAAANHIGLDVDGITKVKLEILDNNQDVSQSLPQEPASPQAPKSIPKSYFELETGDMSEKGANADWEPAKKNKLVDMVAKSIPEDALEAIPESFEENSAPPPATDEQAVTNNSRSIPLKQLLISSSNAPRAAAETSSEPIAVEEAPQAEDIESISTPKSPITAQVPPDAVSIASYDHYEKPHSGKRYHVQIAAYKDKSNAEERLSELKPTFDQAFIKSSDNGMHKVMIGPFGYRSEASSFLAELKEKHQMRGFIIKELLKDNQ